VKIAQKLRFSLSVYLHHTLAKIQGIQHDKESLAITDIQQGARKGARVMRGMMMITEEVCRQLTESLQSQERRPIFKKMAGGPN